MFQFCKNTAPQKPLPFFSNLCMFRKHNFLSNKIDGISILRYGLSPKKQVGTKYHHLGSKIYAFWRVFHPQKEDKEYLPVTFLTTKTTTIEHKY